jgi:hypothetical protein
LYDDLLSASFREAVPVARLGTWADRFDPKIRGVSGVVEYYRNAPFAEGRQPAKSGQSTALQTRGGDPAQGWQQIHYASDLSPVTQQSVLEFGDLLDGAFEDVQRLSGFVAEYKAAADENLTIHEYRRSLELAQDSDGRELIFLLKSGDT